MRLIDADKFILWLMDASLLSVDEDIILDLVDSIKTVDAVPVVRCRECRYCDPSNGIFWCDRFDSAVQIDGMAYCSYGKQKLKEEEEITNERVD